MKANKEGKKLNNFIGEYLQLEKLRLIVICNFVKNIGRIAEIS